MNYVLLIHNSVTNKTGASFEEIKKYLKTDFKSYDYMEGYCDGYLFDDYKILTLEQYQIAVQKNYNILNDKYMLFVESPPKITYPEEDE